MTCVGIGKQSDDNFCLVDYLISLSCDSWSRSKNRIIVDALVCLLTFILLVAAFSRSKRLFLQCFCGKATKSMEHVCPSLFDISLLCSWIIDYPR